MVEATVLKSVRTCLEAVKAQGIAVECAVVFGSQATGAAHQWSDIDLLVVAPP